MKFLSIFNPSFYNYYNTLKTSKSQSIWENLQKKLLFP